jgi:hypothetical protein
MPSFVTNGTQLPGADFRRARMRQVSCWRAWLVCLGRRLMQIKEFLDGSAMLSLPG